MSMDDIPPRRPGRRSDAEAERTRETVAEAALSVFAERGFAGASLRDIAAEAGTAHGLIRHHFGSKEGVWRAAVDQAIRRILADISPHIESADDPAADPVEIGRAAVRQQLDTMRRHPEIVRLIMHEGVTPSPQLTYALDRFVPVGESMRPLFERLQAAGYLLAFDSRTFFLHLLMAGGGPIACPAVTAWVLQRSGFEALDQEAHIERFVNTLFPDAA